MAVTKQTDDVYIAAGANLGDRRANLSRGVDLLTRDGAVHVVRASGVYETSPVGGPPEQPPYLNAVLRVRTALSPPALLSLCLGIENRMGRRRSVRNAPRPIDLDIVLFGEDVIDDPALRVPHPRMHRRRFVLAPLTEIAPDARHPVLGVSAASLLAALPAEDAMCRRLSVESWPPGTGPAQSPD